MGSKMDSATPFGEIRCQILGFCLGEIIPQKVEAGFPAGRQPSWLYGAHGGRMGAPMGPMGAPWRPMGPHGAPLLAL